MVHNQEGYKHSCVYRIKWSIKTVSAPKVLFAWQSEAFAATFWSESAMGDF